MEEIRKDHIRHRILAWMAIATAVLGVTLGVLILSWVYYPYKTIDFKSHYETVKGVEYEYNYKTEKVEYIQGDHTYYIVDYCKYTDIFPTLEKKFIDGIEFTAESTRAILAKGCSKELIPLEIPESLPPGTYRLQVTLGYKMNPLRIVEKVAYSNWFTVKCDDDKLNTSYSIREIE